MEWSALRICTAPSSAAAGATERQTETTDAS